MDPHSGLASSIYVAAGLNGLAEPTDIRWLPAPDNRMLIITKGGTLYIRNNSTGVLRLLGIHASPTRIVNRIE